MSILIKGIDMPKRGKTIRLEIEDNGTVWEEGYNIKGRLQDAEAIQIPKGHGRLIDASELIKSYMKGTKTDIDDFYDTIDIIDNAPTILKSEGRYEHNTERD